jgi:glycosyltransferase involved in cell wall biosynthesis
MSSPATIARLLRNHDNGEYFARLVNQPAPHALRRAPELVYHAVLNALEPRFTMVMPAFNHEAIIEDAISATAATASLPFDCIIVDDGSTDLTVARVRSLFESRPPPLIARATIIRNPVPIYETASDNLGFALADTEIIIEVQADIQIREPAFDALFLRALGTSPTPSALSGRCGHTFASLRHRPSIRSLVRRTPPDSVGLCGKTIETPEIVNPIRGRMYRCETVNRGPWVLLKSDLERHGYLDERHFFQGNDDHDYHRRLFETEARRPLYVPIALYAPLAFGAVRRTRTGLNRDVFAALKAAKRGSPAFHRFLESRVPSSPPEEITGLSLG